MSHFGKLAINCFWDVLYSKILRRLRKDNKEQVVKISEEIKMTLSAAPHRHHFPVSIISKTVWIYHRFNNSVNGGGIMLHRRGQIVWFRFPKSVPVILTPCLWITHSIPCLSNYATVFVMAKDHLIGNILRAVYKS